MCNNRLSGNSGRSLVKQNKSWASYLKRFQTSSSSEQGYNAEGLKNVSKLIT